MWGKERLIGYAVCAAVLIAFLAWNIRLGFLLEGGIFRNGENEHYRAAAVGLGPSMMALSFYWAVPIVLLGWHLISFHKIDSRAPLTIWLVFLILLAAGFVAIGWTGQDDPSTPAELIAASAGNADMAVIVALLAGFFWMLNLCKRATKLLQERDAAA